MAREDGKRLLEHKCRIPVRLQQCWLASEVVINSPIRAEIVSLASTTRMSCSGAVPTIRRCSRICSSGSTSTFRCPTAVWAIPAILIPQSSDSMSTCLVRSGYPSRRVRPCGTGVQSGVSVAPFAEWELLAHTWGAVIDALWSRVDRAGYSELKPLERPNNRSAHMADTEPRRSRRGLSTYLR